MRVVKQSFEILPELNDKVKQIADRAGICYQSEPKGSEEEREKFVKMLIDRKHNSCLEMAVIYILVPMTATRLKNCNFLKNDGLIFAGSIRAWREYIMTNNRDRSLTNSILILLKKNYPLFFDDLKVMRRSQLTVREITNYKGMLENVAVKFITNRAIANQIVRHRPASYLQESTRFCNYKDLRFGSEIVVVKPEYEIYGKDLVVRNDWRSSCLMSESIYLSNIERGASPQAARGCLPLDTKTELITYTNMRQWGHMLKLRTAKDADPMISKLFRQLLEKFREMFPGSFDHLERSVG